MCSNYSPIKPSKANWITARFGTDLPNEPWRTEIYPTYPAPFIYLQDGLPKCELAEFGLRPFWAKDKRFGVKQRVKLSTNQRPIVSTFLSC